MVCAQHRLSFRNADTVERRALWSTAGGRIFIGQRTVPGCKQTFLFTIYRTESWIESTSFLHFPYSRVQDTNHLWHIIILVIWNRCPAHHERQQGEGSLPYLSSSNLKITEKKKTPSIQNSRATSISPTKLSLYFIRISHLLLLLKSRNMAI